MTTYRNARVLGPDGSETGVRAFGVTAGTIASGPAGRAVDLGGSVVTPGFVDAHVHMTGTGLSIDGLDLHGVRSVPELGQALLAFVRRSSERFVVGHGWDDTSWPAPPSRGLVDGIVGERFAYLARVDGHSALVSSSLLRRSGCETYEGVDRDGDGSPTGIIRREASQAARAYLFKRAPLTLVKTAHRSAAGRAASLGITTVHEMAGPYFGAGERELDLWTRERLVVNVVVYYATDDVAMIKERGLRQIGGDFNVAGALGSRTAALTSPYADARGHRGVLYRDAGDVAEFFEAASRAGLQAGVHCIGDAACEAAVKGLERAARRTGIATVRRLRHRLEHFEMSDPRLIARAHALGAGLSMQPAFDVWASGMYEARLGKRRARGMNDFRAAAAGVLGFGTDSPVTPMGPLATIAAATGTHVRSHSLTRAQAWYAATAGAHALARSEDGRVEPGRRADFVVWDGDPVADPAGARVRATFVGGRRVYGAV